MRSNTGPNSRKPAGQGGLSKMLSNSRRAGDPLRFSPALRPPSMNFDGLQSAASIINASPQLRALLDMAPAWRRKGA